MDERKKLREGSRIQLENQWFTVEGFVGTGAGTLCYQCRREDGTVGVLKEVYPEEICLFRDEQKCLQVAEEKDLQALRRLKNKYLAGYRDLQRADRELRSFLPSYQILKAGATACLWMPEYPKKTFGALIQQISNAPEEKARENLEQILKAADSLAQCIGLLHSRGWIYRDVKPDNFGFEMRESEYLMETICIFDLDTLCKKSKQEAAGTPGYWEPEGRSQAPEEKTDIFSIGACLWEAIVQPQKRKGLRHPYDGSFYDEIGPMLREAPLCRGLVHGDIEGFLEQLTGVLKKCLAPRKDRYLDCAALRGDLQALLDKLHEKETAAVISEVQAAKALNVHLYNAPLYAEAQTESLKVLILGFGPWGQKFLDVCLPLSQVCGKGFEVLTVDQNDKAWKSYRKARPGLKGYPELESCLRFQAADLLEGSQALEQIAKAFDADYIFAAHQEEDRAFFLARQAHMLWGKTAYYALNKRKPNRLPMPGVEPVCLSAELGAMPNFAQLERMALNVHLLWNRELNSDAQETVKKFHDPEGYNYLSSIANGVSVKYKLHSLGIDLDTLGPEEAARQLEGKLEGSLGQLVGQEHRRWNAEKLADGWQGPESITEEAVAHFARLGETKYKENGVKSHVCLVPCGDSGLVLPGQRWRSMPLTDKYDDLDKISVLYYRQSCKVAQRLRQRDLLQEASQLLPTRYYAQRKLYHAFNSWLNCVGLLWQPGDHSLLDLQSYEPLTAKLSAQAKQDMDDTDYRIFSQWLGAFRQKFKPMLQEAERRDFKGSDLDMVQSLPYILTYQAGILPEDPGFTLVVPLSGNPGKRSLLRQVAPVLIVRPQKLVLTGYLEKMGEYRDWQKAADFLSGVLACKGLAVQVEKKLLLRASWKEPGRDKELRGRVKKLTGQLKEEGVIYAYAGENETLADAVEQLRREGPGVFAEGVDYTFDEKTGKIVDLGSGRVLTFIPRKASLKIEDHLQLQGSALLSIGQPVLPECFEELWKCYKDHRSLWKEMCVWLAAGSERTVAFDKLPEEKNNAKGSFRRQLPVQCGTAARHILDYLAGEGTICSDYSLNILSAQTLRVEIPQISSRKEAALNRIFQMPERLLGTDGILLYRSAEQGVTVQIASLFCHVPADTVLKGKMGDKRFSQWYGENNQAVTGILDELQRMQVITAWEYQKSTGLQLTFGSYELRQLVTKGGQMLELLVYSAVKECSGFDEAASGAQMEISGLGNREIDVAAARGMQTVFLECKAQAKLQSNPVEKLGKIVREFEGTVRALVIADTVGQNNMDREENDQNLKPLEAEPGQRIWPVGVIRCDDLFAGSYDPNKLQWKQDAQKIAQQIMAWLEEE